MSSFINTDLTIKDPFWLENVQILFQSNRLKEFIPTNDMSYSEKLNAIMRFSIYLSIIMFLYKENYLVFYIPIFIGLFSYFLYDNYKKNIPKTERFHTEINNVKKTNIKPVLAKTNNTCQRPSYNNPLMNVLPTDIKYRPERPPACSSTENMIKEEINEKFNVNLYRDITDIYGKANSQRQYYTTPNTTIPNNQEAFSKWLYGTPLTCKQGNGEQCIANVYNNILADTPFKYKYIN